MRARELYFWAIIGGFLIGVFVRSFLSIGLTLAAFAALLALVAVCLMYAVPHSRDGTKGTIALTLALVAFSLGIVRMDAATLSGDPALTAHLNEGVTITGVVVQEPDARDSSTRISVEADTLITKFSKDTVHAGILVVAPPHANIAYGDHILAYGTLRLPERFDTGEGRQFKYPEYLAVQGITYQLTGAQIESTGEWSGSISKSLAIRAKETYLRGERAALPEPEAGLAGGITAGDKRSIGSELSLDFQKVSLIHMVVLSGYNITVVINAVASVLAWAPQLLRFGASGFIVVFFILMSGGAASAVRAGAMAILAVYAHASKRVFLASRALGFVAAGMVFYQPFTLAFDPGFQLSVLATVGLIAFTPLISARLSWVTAKWGMREIMAATLGTQLAVLPLLLYQNGNLSLVALPANLLALAPVPLAMFFSFIAALSGIFFGTYAAPLAAPAYIVLAYIIAVGRFFAALPFASITLPAFGAWWIFAAYALLFAGAAALHARENPSA